MCRRSPRPDGCCGCGDGRRHESDSVGYRHDHVYDVDLTDVHTATAVKTGGSLGGTLALAAVSESGTTEPGTVAWTYEVDNAAVQYLGVGETATETFTVTIDDGKGGTVSQTVTVVVTGTNDAPTITTALTDDAGAVAEDTTAPTLSDTGTITFDDIDLTDAHTVTARENGRHAGRHIDACCDDSSDGCGCRYSRLDISGRQFCSAVPRSWRDGDPRPSRSPSTTARAVRFRRR